MESFRQGSNFSDGSILTPSMSPGDDPYLGSQLTRAYVRGVQSQGVLAVVKHWVFNSQETNRGVGYANKCSNVP